MNTKLFNKMNNILDNGVSLESMRCAIGFDREINFRAKGIAAKNLRNGFLYGTPYRWIADG